MSKGCVEMADPWQLCRTLSSLLSQRFLLASAKGRNRSTLRPLQDQSWPATRPGVQVDLPRPVFRVGRPVFRVEGFLTSHNWSPQVLVDLSILQDLPTTSHDLKDQFLVDLYTMVFGVFSDFRAVLSRPEHTGLGGLGAVLGRPVHPGLHGHPGLEVAVWLVLARRLQTGLGVDLFLP